MMALTNVTFVKSAADAAGFLRDGLPQVIFAGRSNVGKSSLLNCLARKKLLARVSATPGKTAHVNYFLVNEAFYLVDLPGYGYAKVSHKEQERWGRLMSEFFGDTSAVALGLMVVDIRHKPTSGDQEMAALFRGVGVPFIVGANKCDKLKPSQAAAGVAVIRETLALEPGQALIPCSAEKGTGRAELTDLIANAVGARITRP